MFDEYAEKLKNIKANVPAVFKRVAKNGAIHARNQAVKITDKEKLVDIGAYRESWHAEGVEVAADTYGITLVNSMNYASHLEWGHKLRGDIPYAVKRPYEIKRPRNMEKGRYKGFFVGRRALDDTSWFCVNKLDEQFEKLYKSYHKGFTKPD